MQAFKRFLTSVLILFVLSLGLAVIPATETSIAYAGKGKKKGKKKKEPKKHKSGIDEWSDEVPDRKWPGKHGHDEWADEWSDEDADEWPDRLDCLPCPRQMEGYAQRVVRFRRGPAVKENNGRPDDALGSPDASPPRLSGLVSLGMGGKIVLAFTRPYIFDGPVFDFVVLEGTYGGLPVEKARFAVSQGPGMPFFPIRPRKVTGKGIYKLWFDLEDAGLQCARLLRIKDDGDATAGGNGFDVDAVRVIHGCARRR